MFLSLASAKVRLFFDVTKYKREYFEFLQKKTAFHLPIPNKSDIFAHKYLGVQFLTSEEYNNVNFEDKTNAGRRCKKAICSKWDSEHYYE
jgi:hypothetical protein